MCLKVLKHKQKQCENGNNLWIKSRLKFPLENIHNKNGQEVSHLKKNGSQIKKLDQGYKSGLIIHRGDNFGRIDQNLELDWNQILGGRVVTDKLNWTHVRILRHLSTALMKTSVTAVTSYSVHPWPLWNWSSLWRWLSFMADVTYSFWTRTTWVVSVRVRWGSSGRIFSGIILSACNFGSCCCGCSFCSRCVWFWWVLFWEGWKMFQSQRNWTDSCVRTHVRVDLSPVAL